MNVRDVLRHFARINRSYWQCIDWNANELFSKVKNDKNNHLWLYMMIIVWNISTFLYNIERIFTNGSLRLQWLNGIGSWGVCDAGWDFFVLWLAAKPQEPMTIAWVNRSQQLYNISSKFLHTNSITGTSHELLWWYLNAISIQWYIDSNIIFPA